MVSRPSFSFQPALISAISEAMTETPPDAREILAMIQPRFRSAERARAWFEKEPLPGFSDLTAKQLVDEGRGAEVRHFIAAVDAGIHS